MNRLPQVVLLGVILASCSPAPRAFPDRLPVIEGRVVERLDAPPFSFLRIATAEGDVWVGVPVSVNPKEAVVKVEDGVLVRNRRLPALDRTLDAVYFGRMVSH